MTSGQSNLTKGRIAAAERLFNCIDATWRTRLNLRFLRPARVHKTNDKSLCSASFGRPSVKRFAIKIPNRCPVCPACHVRVLWPDRWMDQDETWHGCRPRPGHIVLDGNPTPPKKGHSPPPTNCPIMTHSGHLANRIELVLPSAHPSPQPKRQVDQFSRSYTAHGRKSLYLTMDAPSPVIAPSHEGIWTPVLLWPPCVADANIMFCPVVSSSYLLFSSLLSALADWIPTILPHMVRP